MRKGSGTLIVTATRDDGCPGHLAGDNAQLKTDLKKADDIFSRVQDELQIAEARIADLERELEEQTKCYADVEAERQETVRALLKATRERDEARIRLTLIHALDDMEPEGLTEIAAIVAARAAGEKER